MHFCCCRESCATAIRTVQKIPVYHCRGVAPKEFARSLSGSLDKFYPRPLTSMSTKAAASSATPAPVPNENFEGKMLEPSPANVNWVRLLASLAAVAIAARSTGVLPVQLASFVHLLSFSINFGMIFWVTFVAGITMFKNMGRQAFGRLQSKLFPKYFAISVFTLALQLGTLIFALPLGFRREQVTSLGIALTASLLNYLVEPIATKVMFERYTLENSDGPKDQAKIKDLKSKFGKFHGLSSLLNLIVFVAICAHGYWLSSQLRFV